MRSQFFSTLKIIILAVLLSGVVAFAAGNWTNPTVSPTGGNIEPPINTSTTTQLKNGILGVNGFIDGAPTFNLSSIPNWKALLSGSIGIDLTQFSGSSGRNAIVVNGNTVYNQGSNAFVAFLTNQKSFQFWNSAGTDKVDIYAKDLYFSGLTAGNSSNDPVCADKVTGKLILCPPPARACVINSFTVTGSRLGMLDNQKKFAFINRALATELPNTYTVSWDTINSSYLYIANGGDPSTPISPLYDHLPASGSMDMPSVAVGDQGYWTLACHLGPALVADVNDPSYTDDIVSKDILISNGSHSSSGGGSGGVSIDANVWTSGRADGSGSCVNISLQAHPIGISAYTYTWTGATQSMGSQAGRGSVQIGSYPFTVTVMNGSTTVGTDSITVPISYPGTTGNTNSPCVT